MSSCRVFARKNFHNLVFILLYGLCGGLFYRLREANWTSIDSFYFCMTTMSTVGCKQAAARAPGYPPVAPPPRALLILSSSPCVWTDGDFSPGSADSRIFTVFFILVGVCGAFPALASMLSVVVDPTTSGGREALERIFPPKRIDIDGDGECDYVLPCHWTIYYTKNLLPSVLLNVLVQLVSAVFFMMLEPAWTFGDAFYHCIITATTVGYGDVRITTQGGRLWGGFQILVSVVLLGELISTTGKLQKAREAHLQKNAQLEARLDEQLVPRLMARVDELRPPSASHGAEALLAEQGLTELEFVLANLIELEMVSSTAMSSPDPHPPPDDPVVGSVCLFVVRCAGERGRHAPICQELPRDGRGRQRPP